MIRLRACVEKGIMVVDLYGHLIVDSSNARDQFLKEVEKVTGNYLQNGKGVFNFHLVVTLDQDGVQWLEEVAQKLAKAEWDFYFIFSYQMMNFLRKKRLVHRFKGVSCGDIEVALKKILERSRAQVAAGGE